MINNFKRYEKQIYLNCRKAVDKAKYKNNILYLDTKEFKKNKSIPFDQAILEKSREINASHKFDLNFRFFGKKRKTRQIKPHYSKPGGKGIKSLKMVRRSVRLQIKNQNRGNTSGNISVAPKEKNLSITHRWK